MVSKWDKMNIDFNYMDIDEQMDKYYSEINRFRFKNPERFRKACNLEFFRKSNARRTDMLVGRSVPKSTEKPLPYLLRPIKPCEEDALDLYDEYSADLSDTSDTECIEDVIEEKLSDLEESFVMVDDIEVPSVSNENGIFNFYKRQITKAIASKLSLK